METYRNFEFLGVGVSGPLVPPLDWHMFGKGTNKQHCVFTYCKAFSLCHFKSIIGQNSNIFSVKLLIFFPSVLTYVLNVQKTHLIDCLTEDPGVTSSIPARSLTFVEIDHKIIYTAVLFPSAD